MPANECIPFHKTGDVTFTASGAVTGKRFVKIAGNRESGPGLSTTSEGSNYVMSQCTVAGEVGVGVAAYDVATGKKGALEGTTGSIVPVTSGAAVTAGAPVKTDAAGKAIAQAGAGQTLGIAMSGVGGADLDLEVKLLV